VGLEEFSVAVLELLGSELEVFGELLGLLPAAVVYCFGQTGLLGVEVASEYPLGALVEYVAGRALGLGVVWVPPCGPVSPALEVSALYLARVVSSAAREAPRSSVRACGAESDVYAPFSVERLDRFGVPARVILSS
jgi:hypothetical protein